MKLINEFSKGDKIVTELMVASSTNGVSNNGTPYMTITFQDKSGTIDAKLWSVTDELAAALVAGNIGEVNGEIIEYKGALQMKLLGFQLSDMEQVDKSRFVKRSEYSEEQLKKVIDKVLDEIKNPIIKAITQTIVAKNSKDFYEYPAATKNHHEFVSGLATHVYGMLRLGKAMCDIYPQLNSDLLYAGIILHDIGKLEELSGAIASEYTVAGKLLGHISIMQANIAITAMELGYADSEETMLLRHMVLSHHGEYEYGSPVLPLTPEAEMLSYIDNIDARMNMLDKVLANVEAGSFASKAFFLENRAFYKSKV